MTKIWLPVILILCIGWQRAAAASVDTVEVESAAMHKKIKAVVVTPSGYSNGDAFPVVYLLHGFGDNYATGLKMYPPLKKMQTYMVS